MSTEYLRGFDDAVELIQHTIADIEQVKDIKEVIEKIEATIKDFKIERLKQDLLLL